MQPQTQRLCSLVLAVLTAAALLAVPVAPAGAQVANESTNTTITVSASGQASDEPNTAVLRLESAATAESPGQATERLANNTSQLRSALTAAGLTADEIRTIYYSVDEVRPPVEIPRPGPSTDGPTTYRAQQGFEITVANTSRVGELVDLAVENGTTSVLGVEFRLSAENRSQARQAALEAAMADARAQAEILAGSESLEIVGVQSISAGEPFFGPVRAFETAGGGAGTTIDSGPVSVEVTVTVTYTADAS